MLRMPIPQYPGRSGTGSQILRSKEIAGGVGCAAEHAETKQVAVSNAAVIDFDKNNFDMATLHTQSESK